jgi:lysyl-tRNA synthetase class 2
MKPSVPLDEEFFACLQAGMPPSGGIAFGLERLFMAFYQIENISDLRVFPL